MLQKDSSFHFPRFKIYLIMPIRASSHAQLYALLTYSTRQSYTNVVPKLELALSRWTCNATYWNSEEAHVFCSSLSFQQALADVYICMSNRSHVTFGFVKTFAHTSLENERCKNRTKKMGEVFNVQSMGSVRGKVSVLFTIKKNLKNYAFMDM